MAKYDSLFADTAFEILALLIRKKETKRKISVRCVSIVRSKRQPPCGIFILPLPGGFIVPLSEILDLPLSYNGKLVCN